jgi:hypothetical protein
MDNPQVMQVRKCHWSHNLMKRGGACGRSGGNLEKAHKRYKDFANESR